MRRPEDLARELDLTADEQAALQRLDKDHLPLSITPYWLKLIKQDRPGGPLRRQLVPTIQEWDAVEGELKDPLGEEERLAAPSLVHRYPDRALLLVTDRCASYCRFCTRKRWVGQGPTPRESDVAAGIDYIASQPGIHEVILSGGDALLLEDDKLAALMARLKAIEHVQVIRVASRLPAFAPMRITKALVQALQPFHPVYFLVHFNHAAEITPDVATALTRLADHGFPVLCQTVLLKGINDDPVTLETLFRRLVQLRCRPYYLHQCDAIAGAAHFRTTLEAGLGLMDSLRGKVSGLALPTYVVDVPGGQGKVPMARDPRVASAGEGLVRIRGSLGGVAEYPEPV